MKQKLDQSFLTSSRCDPHQRIIVALLFYKGELHKSSQLLRN